MRMTATSDTVETHLVEFIDETGGDDVTLGTSEFTGTAEQIAQEIADKVTTLTSQIAGTLAIREHALAA